MASLKEGQKLRRVIKVYGLGDTIATLTHEGIEFKVPGTKVGVGMSWKKAVDSCFTPQNVPSKHEGRPLDFLVDQAAKQAKRRAKRAEKAEEGR